jgi:hypothetical protein
MRAQDHAASSLVGFAEMRIAHKRRERHFREERHLRYARFILHPLPDGAVEEKVPWVKCGYHPIDNHARVSKN